MWEIDAKKDQLDDTNDVQEFLSIVGDYQVVGTISLIMSEGEGEIGMLSVDQNLLRLGIARLLLHRAHELIK
jgi:N-acetylglutamate synthase-like GNAT family acetyltransferase